jgi:hypothetical protein
LGQIPAETRTRIDALSLEQLEDLAEALLNFALPADLNGWLDQVPQPGDHA